MVESTYFIQECPTCGRSLRIRVEYLGRHVVCQHCRGKLIAHDPEGCGPIPTDSGIGLLQRAEELLDLVEQRKVRPR